MADNKLLLEFDVNDKTDVKFRKINNNVDGLGNKLGHATKQTDSLDNGLNKLGKRALIAAGAFIVLDKAIDIGGSLIKTADSMTLVDSKLKLVTDSTKDLVLVQKELFVISQDSRIGFTDTVDLYSRMARSTKSLGISQKELLEITDTISKTLIISGGSAESMNAALVQLGQGFASGTLRGEELNSVMEQTPRLAKAIADGMGIQVGQLRKMGGQGLITAKVVTDALKTQADSVKKEFLLMATTVDQSWTQVGNAGSLLVGELDDALGATETLSTALTGMSGIIQDLTKDVKLLTFRFADPSELTTLTEVEDKIADISRKLSKSNKVVNAEYKNLLSLFTGKSLVSELLGIDSTDETLVKKYKKQLQELVEIRGKLVADAEKAKNILPEPKQLQGLDTTIQISIADESWDEMDAEIEKEVDKFSVKDIKLSFVPQEQQIRDFVTEFEEALNRFPDNLNEVNTFYLAKYKSITEDDQKEQSKLNDDMNDRINNAISSSITNAIVDGINGSSLEDTIKGLAQSIGAQVTEAGTSALVGGAVGGFAAANPVTAIALGVGLTALSAFGGDSTPDPTPQEISRAEMKDFIDGLIEATKVLDSFGSTGSSLSNQVDSILANISTQNTRIDKVNEFWDNYQRTFLDDDFTGNRDFNQIGTYVTQYLDTYNLNLKALSEELSDILTESVAESLTFDTLNIPQLKEAIGDFDASAYVETLTQINDLAIKAKQQGGTLTEADKNTLIELYTLPNFVKGKDYAPAIEALKELNETLFDMTQTANEWELDLFSLGKTQKEISALRITQVQEEKHFLAEQLPELTNLTASNFISLYEMIDPSNTDLIESYEEYADLLVEQANLTFEFNQAIESMGDSITNTINTIKGNMLDDTDTSDLIKRYNDTQRIIQFQASQGVDTSDYVVELNSLAKSISGSAFGDATNLNTNLINTLEQTKLDIGFQDEIINVNIVSSDLTVTDTAVPSVFVTNTATNDSERALNIEAIQTELLINQKNIYKLLLRLENDGIKTI